MREIAPLLFLAVLAIAGSQVLPLTSLPSSSFALGTMRENEACRISLPLTPPGARITAVSIYPVLSTGKWYMAVSSKPPLANNTLMRTEVFASVDGMNWENRTNVATPMSVFGALAKLYPDQNFHQQFEFSNLQVVGSEIRGYFHYTTERVDVGAPTCGPDIPYGPSTALFATGLGPTAFSTYVARTSTPFYGMGAIVTVRDRGGSIHHFVYNNPFNLQYAWDKRFCPTVTQNSWVHFITTSATTFISSSIGAVINNETVPQIRVNGSIVNETVRFWGFRVDEFLYLVRKDPFNPNEIVQFTRNITTNWRNFGPWGSLFNWTEVVGSPVSYWRHLDNFPGVVLSYVREVNATLSEYGYLNLTFFPANYTDAGSTCWDVRGRTLCRNNGVAFESPVCDLNNPCFATVNSPCGSTEVCYVQSDLCYRCGSNLTSSCDISPLLSPSSVPSLFSPSSTSTPSDSPSQPEPSSITAPTPSDLMSPPLTTPISSISPTSEASQSPSPIQISPSLIPSTESPSLSTPSESTPSPSLDSSMTQSPSAIFSSQTSPSLQSPSSSPTQEEIPSPMTNPSYSPSLFPSDIQSPTATAVVPSPNMSSSPSTLSNCPSWATCNSTTIIIPDSTVVVLNSSLVGSVVIGRESSLIISSGSSVNILGSVVSLPGALLILNPNSSFSIDGELILSDGAKLEMAEEAKLDINGCLNLNNSTLTVKSSSAPSGLPSTVVINYDCLDGNFSSINVESNRSCAISDAKTDYRPSQLVITFIPQKTNCEYGSVQETSTFPMYAIVIVVVAVVLVAAAIIVVFAVPSIRQRILPHKDRENFKSKR